MNLDDRLFSVSPDQKVGYLNAQDEISSTVMPKRLIEVDDAKVAKARELLGVSTLKATIDGALDELIALDARRRSLVGLGEPPTEMANDDTRRAAWG